MEATKDFISLETAKLLKDCGVESKLYFAENEDWIVEKYKIDDSQDWKDGYFYPAYTWQEILWEYPKEFFGYILDPVMYDENYSRYINDYEIYTIFQLLQAKEYNEADLYFRENCILI